ncbi:MAG: TldD/PmbA family protein [Lachnospiraceae bacterium]|nr:TldD/PmbA family protein [Lachnospiraceae bacterium]
MDDLKQYIRALDCYGELKTENTVVKVVSFANGKFSESSKSEKKAVCRVFRHGSWGMAYSNSHSKAILKALIQKALLNADIPSNQMTPSRGGSNISLENFSISKSIIAEKKDYNKSALKEITTIYNNYILKEYPGLDETELSFSLRWAEKWLVTTTGAELFSLVPEATMFLRIASGNYSVEESFSKYADLDFFVYEWENIEPAIASLYEHLQKKKEAISIADTYATCILSPKMSAKMIHESIGHHAEADFMLSSFPNAPIKKLPDLNEKINIVDYASKAFGELCPLPVYIDDEGVIARDVEIIKNGKPCSLMTNRETASLLDLPLTGNARASGCGDSPLIRMRNTALLPADETVADMISSVKEGYYLIDGYDGYSDINGEFAYQVAIGYHIKNGKLAESLKDCIIWGECADFLSSITMIGNDFKWYLSECSKKQSIKLSSGAPSVKAKLNIGMEA